MNDTTVNGTVKTKTPAKKKSARISAADKRAIMESLGLVRVRGAVSGKIYYE